MSCLLLAARGVLSAALRRGVWFTMVLCLWRSQYTSGFVGIADHVKRSVIVSVAPLMQGSWLVVLGTMQPYIAATATMT